MISLLTLTLALLSSEPSVLWGEAARLEAAGRPEEGAALLKPLAQRQPKDYDLQMRVAWLYFQAKRYEIAERHYLRALEVSPTAWDAKEGLAWSQYHQNQREAATRTLESLAQDHPENLDRALRLATLHAQMQAHPEAERRYRRALALDGAHEAAQTGLAWSLYHQGKRKAASQAVNALARLQPKSYTGSMKLAWLHFEMKAYHDAEEHYRAALAQSLASEDARLGLAWSLYYQGEEGEAGDLFKGLLAQRPKDNSVLQGYQLTHPPWYWTVELGGTNHDYGKHPDVTSGFSGKASLAVTNRNWVFQGSFQRDQFHYEPRSFNWNDTEASDVEQGTFYLGLGYNKPRFGLKLDGTYVSSNYLDPSPRAVAVTSRWSTLGSLFLTLAMIQVDDLPITSERLHWSFPLTARLVIDLGATATQDLDGANLLWYDATATMHQGPISFFAGGGAGEHRNAFEPPSFYSLSGLMRWRGTSGVKLWIAQTYFASAFFEMAEFETDDDTPWSEAHTIMWTGGAIGATFATQ
ncbi:tetratricopeptide repeat protein [Myxococcota bacterium]|nr:tetratricopeptide repeat protein [Myxococcota bacterium]MBU1896679.1 tetratricopeptide repeat protein [Myxococcota bacterium]